MEFISQVNQMTAMDWGMTTSKRLPMKQRKWQNEPFSREGKVKFQNL